MRRVILLAPTESISSEDAGYISRFVVGALLLSHGARRDVRVDLVFDGDGCISLEGASMRNVRPDEQSLSGILRAGLRRLREVGGGRIMQGINIYPIPVEELLREARGNRLYFTGAGGKSSGFGKDFFAFFQFPRLEEEMEGKLMKMGFNSVNLGRCKLSPDQAVVVLHNRADRNPAGG
jgi:tRNA pseudouridine-54 N-methylase